MLAVGPHVGLEELVTCAQQWSLCMFTGRVPGTSCRSRGACNMCSTMESLYVQRTCSYHCAYSAMGLGYIALEAMKAQLLKYHPATGCSSAWGASNEASKLIIIWTLMLVHC